MLGDLYRSHAGLGVALWAHDGAIQDMQNTRLFTLARYRRRPSIAWRRPVLRCTPRVLVVALLLISSLLLASGRLLAAAPKTTAAGSAESFTVQGARDGAAPAWTINAVAPSGWTADCCTYARAIGVNFVLYRGEWTGHPQQVMVLNVWPRKLPTLGAEIQADRQHFLQADPAARVSSIPIRHPRMPCQATLYQGTDHVDDIVVFCEPARASGIRWSWSMTLDAADPARRTLLDAFMRVVMASRHVPAGNSGG